MSEDSDSGLNNNQLKVIECILGRDDEETNEEVAARAGVDVRTYYRYMKDDRFVDELMRARNRGIAGAAPITDRKLIRAVISGDVKAMSLFYRRAGELVTNVAATIDGNVTIDTGLDFSLLDSRMRQAALLIAEGKVSADEYVMLTRDEYQQLTRLKLGSLPYNSDSDSDSNGNSNSNSANINQQPSPKPPVDIDSLDDVMEL